MADSSAPSVESVPAFTAQEADFLRRYSECYDRALAMHGAGMGAPTGNADAVQAMLDRAAMLVWRAEQMNLQAIASAVGADKIFFCGQLRRICMDAHAGSAIKGLSLLGRIHGAWDEGRRHPRARSLRLEPPEPRTAPRRVSNLPFEVGNLENGQG